MNDKTIIQLVPCTAPMYNVFKNDDNGYFHERVCCLALCKDGLIRSIAGGEYFDFADEESNFVGCYDEDSLIDFPVR